MGVRGVIGVGRIEIAVIGVAGTVDVPSRTDRADALNWPHFGHTYSVALCQLEHLHERATYERPPTCSP